MSGNAALALLRQEAHVSLSSVGCWVRCPEQWHHRYAARTPPSHKSANLCLGSATHEALAHFYTALQHGRPEPSAGELAAAFSDTWTRELKSPLPIKFAKNDTAVSLRDKGVALMRVFHAEAPRPHKVLGVEEPFSVEICDPTTGEVFDERLVGAVDAVVQRAPGEPPTLLEHKTAATKHNPNQHTHLLQGALYAHVAPLIGLPDAEVTLQILVKTKTPTLQVCPLDITPQDRLDAMRAVAGVIAAARAGIHFPVPSWQCAGCPYAYVCRPQSK